ncbi:SDR family oxidoreductase [soil metagenome]
MKTYLVTGGCGFIGSHLVEALIKEGHEVIVVDNLTTGKRENIPKNVELIIDDIRNQQLLNLLMARVDGCFHLAAVVSTELSNLYWVETNQVNLSGTINIFNAAKRGRMGLAVPVVYTSSSAIYGNNTQFPLAETEIPYPLTAYGIDKLGCEFHARIGWQIHGIPTVGLRLFNVYGPRQNINSVYSGVISLFFDKINQEQPITIYGDGEQTRDFIYVEDVVQAFIKSMNNVTQGNRVYNICTQQTTSINQLKDLIGEILHKPVNSIYTQARKGDVYQSIGNPNKARQELGLTVSCSLPQGLQKLADYLHSSSTSL